MKRKLGAKDEGLIALCIALIACAGYALALQGRITKMSGAADAALRRAMYESAELLGGMQGGLLKLPASASSEQEQLLLSDIARQAFGVQEQLGCIPTGRQQTQGALKFVNQVQDYADVLTGKISRGGGISDEDYRQISQMAQASFDLQAQLLGSAESLGPIRFSAPDEFSGTIEQGPSVEYPTLIYDGPFSDAADDRTLSLPDGKSLSMQEALNAAADFVGGERGSALRPGSEISLPTECYVFDAETKGGTLSICVTKKGGHILYMISDRAVGSAALSQSECIDRAKAFLSERGYAQMQPTFRASADGLCTISFAAVQDGILLYPDLIKVTVAEDNGEICGIEARGYLENHRIRDLPEAAVSETQARRALSRRLNVNGSRLCVIPTDFGEALAWEFGGDIEGAGSYLVYIDALSGRELEILRLVETETGLETQ